MPSTIYTQGQVFNLVTEPVSYIIYSSIYDSLQITETQEEMITTQKSNEQDQNFSSKEQGVKEKAEKEKEEGKQKESKIPIQKEWEEIETLSPLQKQGEDETNKKVKPKAKTEATVVIKSGHSCATLLRLLSLLCYYKNACVNSPSLAEDINETTIKSNLEHLCTLSRKAFRYALWHEHPWSSTTSSSTSTEIFSVQSSHLTTGKNSTSRSTSAFSFTSYSYSLALEGASGLSLILEALMTSVIQEEDILGIGYQEIIGAIVYPLLTFLQQQPEFLYNNSIDSTERCIIMINNISILYNVVYSYYKNNQLEIMETKSVSAIVKNENGIENNGDKNLKKNWCFYLLKLREEYSKQLIEETVQWWLSICGMSDVLLRIRQKQKEKERERSSASNSASQPISQKNVVGITETVLGDTLKSFYATLLDIPNNSQLERLSDLSIRISVRHQICRKVSLAHKEIHDFVKERLNQYHVENPEGDYDEKNFMQLFLHTPEQVDILLECDS